MKKQAHKLGEMKWIDVDLLVMLRRNPQYLAPHAMEALKASLKRDGFIAPVLVRPYKGKQFEVLSGNHRVMAARELGMTQVPVMIVKFGDQQAGRVAVNLNTVHGDPTAELLAPFLAELDEDTLRTVHLDEDMLKDVMEIDKSLGESLAKMQTPDGWDHKSVKTEIGQCVCKKCGKRHIKGSA